VKVATIAVPDLSPARFHQAIFRVFCINRIGKGQGVEHQIFSFRSPGDAPRSDSETGLMLDFARFEAGHLLADNWLRLERYACLPTQTLGFVEALAGTLLEPEDIAVFVGRGPQGIAALIPLCREPKGTARWRLAGAREVFEPGDALCDGEEGAALLAQALVRDGRPLDLDRIPASSLLIPALREAMRGRGMLSLRPARPCPTIALDASWGQGDSFLNAGRRSDFRRAERRAAAMGAVFHEIIAPDPAEFDMLFDEAIGVEMKSWKHAAGSAIGCDPDKEAFARAWFHHACDQGSCASPSCASGTSRWRCNWRWSASTATGSSRLVMTRPIAPARRAIC
jgi:hypothetical protein